jgi:CHAT domain-containing protein/Tfp pilus assembly protein PilF
MNHPRSCARFLLLAAVLSPHPSPAQESRLQELNAQVGQLARQGKFADAVPLATEAVRVAEATYGPDSAKVAGQLNTLGLAYYYQGLCAQAEPLYQRAVRIAEKALGPDSPELASDLGNLAMNYSKEKKFAEAVPLLERTVSIYEKALGPDNPRVAMALNGLGALFVSQAKYAQAETIYLRSLTILEKAAGSDRPELVPAMQSLADVYIHEGKDAQAEPLCQRVLAIYEKAFPANGPDRPEVAGALERLGEVYIREEKYAQAEPLTRRALEMFSKALGPDSPSNTNDLSDLALVELQLGKYAESETLYKHALTIYVKADGPDHLDVAQALNNLADLYFRQGRYTEAEPLYARALEIRVKKLGPDDPLVAHTLNNLANLDANDGKLQQAEAIFQRVQAIQEKAQLPEDRNFAASLNDLATLYIREGKYAQAEPLLQHALHINESLLGPDHINVAYELNNLANLYEAQGKFAEAEPLLKRSLSIREKTQGPDHPDVAAGLANLGQLYENQEKYADAKPLFLRALAIETKALGTDHPSLAATYQDVAVLLMKQGILAQAGQFYQQALTINEKALGPDHPEVSFNLEGLALVDSYQAKYDQAEPLFQRAIRINQAAVGPDHPSTGNALENLALMYDREGKVADAETIYTQANDSLFHQFQYSFSYMTEKDRLSFLDKVTGNFHAYFSFVHRNHEQDPALIGSMYNLLLWQKGFVAGSVASMRRKVEASGDAEALKLLGQLTDKRTQIAALLNVTPTDRGAWRKQVEQLESDAADIEKALVARSSAFAEQKQLERATWQQVRDALKPGEAAVEFARFQYSEYHQLHWTFRTYYVALVVTQASKDHPQYVFLGDDKQIESDAIAHFQHALQTRGFQQQPQAALPGPHAYDLIWKPLDASLAGITRVDLAADGSLNQVPLGIIPAPDGKLLMEKYDLRLLSSTRDMLRSAALARSASTTALLVGNPVFDLSEDQQRAALQKLTLPRQPTPMQVAALLPGSRSRDLGGGTTLPSLPGTGLEVSAIAALMQKQGWKISTYTGDQALKTVVEQTGNPRVMHLATHGFFLPDQEIKTQQPGAPAAEAQPAALEDPMLRSGLYFAAADRTLAGKPSPPGLDNGVLTALEAGNLNLTGTQLVVLSACDTGQGDVKNGEGVFGLRRALEEAGAQSVLMSLWSVPDKETLELMQHFYAKWLSGAEVHQALKDAQLEMREQVKLSHDGKDLPYYWGAFVLVGR